MAYTKYSLTPADNNSAPPNGAPEGMLPSGVNDTMRDMMSQIRDVGDGIRGGTYTMTAPVITGGSITGITDLAVADGGTGSSTAAGALTNLGAAGIDTAQTYTKGQRAEVTALTDGTNISVDLADSNNFSVTLGGNRTLDNPSNIVAGQSGSFFITQDGTGSRTLAYGSYYDFAGGTAPTLSTTAAAVDRIDYIVRSSTSIHCVFTANYS